MNVSNSFISGIKRSFPKADPNIVREIGSLISEDDANLIRKKLNDDERREYEVRYFFNKEENTSYLHIRRLK